MRTTIPALLAITLALCALAPAASAGLINDNPGELDLSALYWFPGDGDFDLYKNGYGIELSYREWFNSCPWGLGLTLGLAQWQADENSDDAFKIKSWEKYDGSILYIPLGLSLYFCAIEWDNWNLILDAGLRYVFITSDIDVFDTNLKQRRDIDIDSSLVANIGLGLEFLLTENFYLSCGGGYQANVFKGDAEAGHDSLRDNSLQGAYARLGVKCLF